MDFECAYHEFIRLHSRARRGHGRERIREGLQHAEKLFLENVWWPAFGQFDGLHPEYEVHDFRDGWRYIDFAFIQPHFRIAIEIDGFSSHWKDSTPTQFADHCERQNHLVIDRWYVLRFAYLNVHRNPRTCQQAIHQLIGRLTGDLSGDFQTLSATGREIMRLVMSKGHPITARDVMVRLGLGRNAATLHLKKLAESGWVAPASGTVRIRSYRIHPSRGHIQL